MATSFGALCSDFYVNHKLVLKMDLPGERESILHLFEQVRKAEPTMRRFRRYSHELVLESSRREPAYQWLSIRRNSIRSGTVNPQAVEDSIRYHRNLLKITPYLLTISPLDIGYMELMYGFDLECNVNQDEVVFDALIGDSPIADLLKFPESQFSRVLNVQPNFGISLSKSGNLQAYFEVKTRPRTRRGRTVPGRNDPISLLLSVRKYNPVNHLDKLEPVLETLHRHCETLASEHLVPSLLMPIARQITSSSA